MGMQISVRWTSRETKDLWGEVRDINIWFMRGSLYA